MLHRGPVTAVAALPEAQGALALTGGQDAVLQLSSFSALAAGNADNGASAAAQPLVAYRCAPLLSPSAQQGPIHLHLDASGVSLIRTLVFV